MTASFEFNIPETLAERLLPVQDQLPRILELRLRRLRVPTSPDYMDANDVLEFLASLPSPQEILMLRPTESLQTRIDTLLEKNRTEGLTANEREEWEQYQYLEHLVRMAKARAYQKAHLS
jgi:hypothetical protein